MIDVAIEKLADEVLCACGVSGPPVDLDKIACEEGIRLAPGDYGDSFSGRIEYLSEIGKFIIYHPLLGQCTSLGRVRFSIAHELGHYFMDEHRAALVAGAAHSSVSGFICEKDFERQADTFAAALLAPMAALDKQLNSQQFMTLGKVVSLAQEWQISATCAVIRYVEYATEACAVVLSEDRNVRFYHASDEACERGFKWLGKREIPGTSLALKATREGKSRDVLSGEKKLRTMDWFSNRPQVAEMWEECYPLGYGDQALTLLAFE